MEEADRSSSFDVFFVGIFEATLEGLNALLDHRREAVRLSDPAAVEHQQATRVVVGLKARHEVRLKTHNNKRSTVVLMKDDWNIL